MGVSLKYVRLPRPQSFFYIMSLQTGASMITLSLLFNKVSGLYGILALLTGFHLSPVQLSMYIYSILALALTAFLFPHIKKESPLECLALAWFYLVDSVINAAYTAAFAVSWFLVISQHHHSAPATGPGSTIGDTAGFTSPQFNVSSVDVAAFPANGLNPGEDAVTSSNPSSAPAGASVDASGSPTVGHGFLQPESVQSLGTVCILWTIRVYFILVMLSFARQALRRHAFDVSTSSSRQLPSHSRNASTASAADVDANPFSPRNPEGQGWPGALGRAMVSVGRTYWLGGDEDASWMSGMGRRFRQNGNRQTSFGGVIERERRRRAGTGPPQLNPATKAAALAKQQQHQQLHQQQQQPPQQLQPLQQQPSQQPPPPAQQ